MLIDQKFLTIVSLISLGASAQLVPGEVQAPLTKEQLPPGALKLQSNPDGSPNIANLDLPSGTKIVPVEEADVYVHASESAPVKRRDLPRNAVRLEVDENGQPILPPGFDFPEGTQLVPVEEEEDLQMLQSPEMPFGEQLEKEEMESNDPYVDDPTGIPELKNDVTESTKEKGKGDKEVDVGQFPPHAKKEGTISPKETGSSPFPTGNGKESGQPIGKESGQPIGKESGSSPISEGTKHPITQSKEFPGTKETGIPSEKESGSISVTDTLTPTLPPRAEFKETGSQPSKEFSGSPAGFSSPGSETKESGYNPASSPSDEFGSPYNGSPYNGSPSSGSPYNDSPSSSSPYNGSPSSGSPSPNSSPSTESEPLNEVSITPYPSKEYTKESAQCKKNAELAKEGLTSVFKRLETSATGSSMFVQFMSGSDQFSNEFNAVANAVLSMPKGSAESYKKLNQLQSMVTKKVESCCKEHSGKESGAVSEVTGESNYGSVNPTTPAAPSGKEQGFTHPSGKEEGTTYTYPASKYTYPSSKEQSGTPSDKEQGIDTFGKEFGSGSIPFIPVPENTNGKAHGKEVSIPPTGAGKSSYGESLDDDIFTTIDKEVGAGKKKSSYGSDMGPSDFEEYVRQTNGQEKTSKGKKSGHPSKGMTNSKEADIIGVEDVFLERKPNGEKETTGKRKTDKNDKDCEHVDECDCDLEHVSGQKSGKKPGNIREEKKGAHETTKEGKNGRNSSYGPTQGKEVSTQGKEVQNPDVGQNPNVGQNPDVGQKPDLVQNPNVSQKPGVAQKDSVFNPTIRDSLKAKNSTNVTQVKRDPSHKSSPTTVESENGSGIKQVSVIATAAVISIAMLFI
jgi:hypothetical protein